MNVGLLTFHNAVNYGAVLQCYALSSFLRKNGCNVCVINYCNKDLLSCYKVFDRHRFFKRSSPLNMMHRFFTEVSLLPHRISRNVKFSRFVEEEFNLLYPTSDNLSSLDLIVVGSDQVWNTKLTKGFDSYYWGNFKRANESKLISYAASVEEFWNKEDDDVAKNLLCRFDAISVREAKAADRISKILSRDDVELSVDPTLLIDKNSWSKIAKAPSIRDPYILVYQVRPSERVCKIAKIVAEMLSLKIIYLSASVAGLNSHCCYGASPQEYLGLFEHASFVVCSSFHGTVFSMIFEKPFISVKLNDGKDSRVESLLSKVNAKHRFLSECEEVNQLNNLMEVIKIDPSISESSRNYLIKNL